MSRILDRNNLHIIYTTLLKFGHWNVIEENNRIRVVGWKCTFCKRHEVPNYITYIFNHIAIHILSHAVNGPIYYSIRINDCDDIYTKFLCYLCALHTNYTEEAIVNEDIMANKLFERNYLYDDKSYFESHSHMQLYSMQCITVSCIFCECQYMCRPTDDMIIEHASACFSAFRTS